MAYGTLPLGSCKIGEALADEPFKGTFGAEGATNPKRLAPTMSESELGKVAFPQNQAGHVQSTSMGDVE
jgi:hypothetical protein